jgi:hypothetical protein
MGDSALRRVLWARLARSRADIREREPATVRVAREAAETALMAPLVTQHRQFPLPT